MLCFYCFCGDHSRCNFHRHYAADSGPGSLRQAISDANANPGADAIAFNLPGSGVQTIALASALPTITDRLAINGFSQAGSSANSLANGDSSVHLVRIDGLNIIGSLPTGFYFAAGSDGSSVRGLIIVRFNHAIYADEISNLTIAGNWIGMDWDGVARGTSAEAIYITSFFDQANNIVIGGTAPADRNVISGNNVGIWFAHATTGNSFVQGNFIGTDPTGTLPRGNAFSGVYLFSCTNITIGGATAAARNVISGSTAAGGTGVSVQAGGGHTIQNNFIGTDVSGQYDLGNISDGVFVTGSANNRVTGNVIANNRQNGLNLSYTSTTIVEGNYIGTDLTQTRPLGNGLAGVTISGSTNRIGGLSAGQGNVIEFNGRSGLEVTYASAAQNEISGNSIYDNGSLGIDLYPVGVTTNDVLDADTGPNGLQNFPTLTSASIAFSALTVGGTLNSKPGATYRIEFFATPPWDPTNTPEGKLFLGSTNVTTDVNGNAAFTAVFATVPATNWLITSTATDANGNTSEFSAGIGIAASGAASPMISITGGADAGENHGVALVSWPSAATFFGLEKTASLKPPVQWQTVTSGIVDSGGLRKFALTNDGGTNQFFRLKKP